MFIFTSRCIHFILSDIAFVLFACLFSCSNEKHKEPNPGITTNETTLAPQSQGYFYFQLTPTEKLPYYFSDVKKIIYKDNNDLSRQQDRYMQMLRDAASRDGQDAKKYNQRSSVEVESNEEATVERKANIEGLEQSGNRVVQKTLAN